MDNDYNFKDGHSVNPGKGKKDDGRAATLAMRVSLGDTEFNIVNTDDSPYLSNLAEKLYEDDNNHRDMDIKMAVVHQDTGCTLALQDGKAKTQPKTMRRRRSSRTHRTGTREFRTEKIEVQPFLPTSQRVLHAQPSTLTRCSSTMTSGRFLAQAKEGLPWGVNDTMRMVLRTRGKEGRML
jgi:hypothetical protein